MACLFLVEQAIGFQPVQDLGQFQSPFQLFRRRHGV
jgi:hypothetical protein